MESSTTSHVLIQALRLGLGDFGPMCARISQIVRRMSTERAPVGFVTGMLATLKSPAIRALADLRSGYAVLGAVATRFPRDQRLSRVVLPSLPVMTDHLRVHGADFDIANAILSVFGFITNVEDTTSVDVVFSRSPALQVSLQVLELHMAKPDRGIVGKVLTHAYLLGRVPHSASLPVLISLGYVPKALHAVTMQGPGISLELLAPVCWFLQTLHGASRTIRTEVRGSDAVSVILGALPDALRAQNTQWGVFAMAPCTLLSQLLQADESQDAPPLGDFDIEAVAVALENSLEVAVSVVHDEKKYPVVSHLVSCVSSLCKRKRAVAPFFEARTLGLLERAASAYPSIRPVIEVSSRFIASAAQMAKFGL